MREDALEHNAPTDPLHRTETRPVTCVCGHAEEWHAAGGDWCEGPCEHEGCDCPAFRLFDEGDGDGL